MKNYIHILKRITTIITIIALTVWTLVGQSPYNSAQDGPAVPTVAAMSYGKYADTPVNPINGTTAIQIPLYQVSEGSLSHGVSLNYHTGGLRVSELASEVGLGWHLNAGGVISRTVRGIADDIHNKGYYYTGHDLNMGSSSHQSDIENGDRDGQSDIYFFNVNGITGKFIFDKDQNLIPIPKTDLLIEINEASSGTNRFLGFKITSIDGNKFYFGEYTGGGSTAVQETKIKGSKKHIDAWLLTRIESFDGKHQIDFTYEENNYQFSINRDCYVTKHWDSGQVETENTCSFDTTKIEVEGKILSSIVTTTDEITFDHATRDDLFSNGGSPKRISAIRYETGSFCSEYELTHSYFQQTPVENNQYRRLRLEKIQKVTCTYGSSDEEEPWLFTYNTSFFPHLRSRAYDHWGYYNGMSSNNNYNNVIPYTAQDDFYDNTLSFGNSVRYSVESEMKKGMLTKVTYPTKGYTEYEYEANRYMDDVDLPYTGVFYIETCDFGANCCDEQDDDYTETITGDMMLSGKLGLTLFVDDANWPCYSGDHTGQVSIYNMTGGGGYADGFSINLPGIGYHTLEKSLSDLYLTAGNEYKFVLESHDAKATLGLSYIPSVTNVICGGLRLKQIKTHDGISSTNDIIRTFEYTMEGSSISSGRITNKPRYGYNPNWNKGVIFSSTGLLPLTNSQGSHITYTRVKEINEDAGYIVYKTLAGDFEYSPRYPHIPGKFNPTDGLTYETSSFDEGEQLVQRQELDESEDVVTTIPGLMGMVEKIKIYDYSESDDDNYLFGSSYHEITGYSRPVKVITMMDGVESIVEYTYHENDFIMLPVKVSTTNSDGKTTDVFTQYTVDYDLNSAIKDRFLERHMIGIPYETTTEVNGNLLDGFRTYYAHFTSGGSYSASPSSSYYPRPYYNRRYERTWTDGTLSYGNWVTQGNFLEYNSDGLLIRYQKENWPEVEYTYNSNKLLTDITYEDHVKTFGYAFNTNLLVNIIDIDGQAKIIEYDGLLRKKSILNYCTDVKTSY